MFAHLARPVLQTMLDALGQRPQWQGVVSLGHGGKPEEFRVPSNVIVVPFVPQFEVLKRASLALTHAGINTVKDCLYFGVPMVPVPLFNDQPGNAARIAYHRLGVMARDPWAPQKLTPGELVGLMDTVMADPGYRERTQALGAVLADYERRGPSIEFVERSLSRA
jgi:MGT family glycosyltransferase